VRRVKTETAKITAKGGKPVEGPRVLLETATYDIKGGKIDNAYFLAASGGTLTGKEVYKYDDKGNIVEMTLQGEDGNLLSKETYTYDFDAFGNWTKMITSVAVIEGGKLSFEPTEVTYRSLSYFVDEATLARMSQPAAAPAAATSVPAAATSAPAPAAASPDKQPASVPADNKTAATPLKSNAAPASAERADAKGVKTDGARMAAAPPPMVSTDRTGAAGSSPMASVVRTGSSSAGPVVNSEGEAPARETPERVIARGPVKPVSGGILNGKAMTLPMPLYPEMARRAHKMGVVIVEVIVDVTGRVISAKAVEGPTMLQAAAEAAARQARFSPTLLSGQPVRVSGQITYNFTIK
ncbi:MAG TPA: TonB family protein, partial [Pyrinomonadaceae bacterium]